MAWKVFVTQLFSTHSLPNQIHFSQRSNCCPKMVLNWSSRDCFRPGRGQVSSSFTPPEQEEIRQSQIWRGRLMCVSSWKLWSGNHFFTMAAARMGAVSQRKSPPVGTSWVSSSSDALGTYPRPSCVVSIDSGISGHRRPLLSEKVNSI
jgi:hypothetical protein